MKRLPEPIIQFLTHQGCVVVATIDPDGMPHTSCKGIVHITKSGKVYLLDVYCARTYANLKRNSRMSITSIDEHKFQGYCLKGKARVVPREKLRGHYFDKWKNKITSRAATRVMRSVRGDKGHGAHPEMALPEPKYMIVLEVSDIVDLAPYAKHATQKPAARKRVS